MPDKTFDQKEENAVIFPVGQPVLNASSAIKAPEPPKEPLPLLSKELFFKNNHIRVERVDVPELGGSILVKEMTARERDAFEASLVIRSVDGKNQQLSTADIRAKFVQKVAVDAKHLPMFNEAEIVALGDVSAAAMDRIYKVGSRLSGLSEEDVEEMAKNLASGPQEEH